MEVNNGVENKRSGSGNLLFEEDPLNNYMEEVVVLTIACRAIKTLIVSHCEVLHKPLVVLAQQLCSVASNLQAKLNSDAVELCPTDRMFSPWDEPQVFLGFSKVSLLSEAVVDGVVEADYALSHEFTELTRDLKELKTELLLN